MNLIEVLNLSDTSNTVIVRADANDSVVIGPGWVQDGIASVDDEFYDVFRQGAAKALILITEHPAWQNQALRFDVDNDPATAELVSEAVDLSRSDVQVQTETSGVTQLVSERRPAMVVVNADLPKGWRLCTELKKTSGMAPTYATRIFHAGVGIG